MTLGSRDSRMRCLAVWIGATAGLLATWWLTRAGLGDAAVVIVRHRLGMLPLDRALTDLAAALLLGCGCWLWLVTTYVVLEAARGCAAPRRQPPWLPVGLRRLVLSACGVAVAGALTQPAVAVSAGVHHRHPHHVVVHSPVAGLPLPERAAITMPARGPTDLQRRPGPTTVVAPGDTLWSIAARSLPATAPDAVVARYWRAIYAANRARIGPDPDLIVPGLHLRLPRKDLP